MTSSAHLQSSERHCPSGSRREARTEAILRAALEELAQVGYSAMSIEAVASRVGVAKTTVYRRYPTKLDLIRAAVRQFVDEAVGEPPDTGSLRGDLIALGRQAVLLLSSVLGQSLFRMSLVGLVEPELEKMGRDFESERDERQRVVAARAVARGELTNEADCFRVVEALSGALLFRLIVRKKLVDELAIAGIVDMLLHGISPAPARQRSKPHGQGPAVP